MKINLKRIGVLLAMLVAGSFVVSGMSRVLAEDENTVTIETTDKEEPSLKNNASCVGRLSADFIHNYCITNKNNDYTSDVLAGSYSSTDNVNYDRFDATITVNDEGVVALHEKDCLDGSKKSLKLKSVLEGLNKIKLKFKDIKTKAIVYETQSVFQIKTDKVIDGVNKGETYTQNFFAFSLTSKDLAFGKTYSVEIMDEQDNLVSRFKLQLKPVEQMPDDNAARAKLKLYDPKFDLGG